MSYKNTFILVAEDCPATAGEVPPVNPTKMSKAALEYELLSSQPYVWSQDMLNYEVHRRQKTQLGVEPLSEEAFFGKEHPCLRASPLTKRYGWGAHYDEHGTIALFALGSDTYVEKSTPEQGRRVLKAMRSSRAKP